MTRTPKGPHGDDSQSWLDADQEDVAIPWREAFPPEDDDEDDDEDDAPGGA